MFLTSYLMGGLGNQMFQISKSVAEGMKNNIPIFFRTTSFIPMEGNQPTNYTKNIFRNLNFDNSKIPTFRINEQTWSYNKTNYTYTGPTELYGYYQSSKNFLNFRDEIQKLFLPTEEFKVKLKNQYPNIFEKDSVSIHVRRGDYLGISEVLPVLDKSYFDFCVKEFENSNIFIFSNDKEWVKKNLNYNNSTVVEGLDDYEELWSISLCDHNIMSNSSFSWWGSYLNLNKSKKTYVPSVWFGPNGEKNYQDIYEDGWIKIEVKYINGTLIIK
jgi:hypothetical protein